MVDILVDPSKVKVLIEWLRSTIVFKLKDCLKWKDITKKFMK